ncbi:hypothetical protein DYBT9275_00298 [Dyadobacter sp. CECT 9275]|uniref:Uncharacterized protein n=1 Tax=Dyadobacter helix TaxID=2822344 RepID=A0A916J839_9BACT|nr:glycosyltransferase [Dyadobacter sp. CECT 9275]CAG4989464.1 hypothetical protein DYBT9275_00298 [Dyadobacter sp. CECT 9275]
MRNTLILYPANILSHLIPSLGLAAHLKKDYDIYVLISDPKFEDIVRSQGFCPLIDPLDIAMGNEMTYLKKIGRRYALLDVIFAMVKNELYHERVSTLRCQFRHMAPVAILIDIFHNMECLVLSAVFPKAAIICLNPMLSTYKIDGLPTASERSWVTANSKTQKVRQKWHVHGRMSFSRNSLIHWVRNFQMGRLLKMNRLGKDNRISLNSIYTNLFDNVPELILAPLELELDPKVKLRNQHYLGLCINKSRTDIGIQGKFDEIFSKLKVKRNEGSKIVYCSFGTFYLDSDPSVVIFIKSIISAIAIIPGILEVIFSVKPHIMKTLQLQVDLPKNIHFFTHVPQLLVLENADLYITHGGLGSIKESIFYKVPMLVYPFDFRYDQNGNGLKVEHHKIGLRGVFNQDSSKEVAAKIEKILNNKTYKENISQFSDVVQHTYSDDVISDTIKTLIRQYEPI